MRQYHQSGKGPIRPYWPEIKEELVNEDWRSSVLCERNWEMYYVSIRENDERVLRKENVKVYGRIVD